MLGFNGGLVGKERLATSAALGASGLWLPNEQSVAKRASKWPAGPNDVPAIGAAFGGGFYAGLISHTANGVATHALIVAPAATGASGFGYPVTTMYAWKTSNTTTAGTTSTFDGRANTDAMITAGIASHPAANFCVNLTIGGFTDWYLPAELELEIAYTNLKPTTQSNDTSTGINAYSVPARASNYTAGNPAQSIVAAFQSPSGAERIDTGNRHNASTESNATLHLGRFFTDGSLGTNTKNAANYRTRAFRRVPV
jgi:hypothetical protein